MESALVSLVSQSDEDVLHSAHEYHKSVLGFKSDVSFIVVVWRTMCELRKRRIRCTFGAIKSEIYKYNRQFSRNIDKAISNAIEDKLLIKKTGRVAVYELPTENEVKLLQDMNCFICYSSGADLMKCDSCERVYHDHCYVWTNVKGHCGFCIPITQEKIRGKELTRNNINDLLSVLYEKLVNNEDYRRVLQCSYFLEEKEALGDLNLLSKVLFTHNFNDKSIREKLEQNRYSSLEECVRDFRRIVFNIHVIYGLKSEYSKDAILMFKFIEDQFKYMTCCFECYFYYAQFYLKGKDKKRNIWFLLPCDPPHEITFVKRNNGYYYPAKVITSYRDSYFIWTFGDYVTDLVHFSKLHKNYTIKQPIPLMLKKAIIEMEKYKFVVSKYKNGSIDFDALDCIKKEESDEDDD
ncbi:zinc finger MYND domain-containing protein 11-like protein [Leptotrombidium deliense]|uniref:Zinc finger MYND domain-containing protein 11-like protein n=1 Tax=Leptotrombidium deliense TaxID=299467 RepID=A0A443S0P3_9ACAR|nr:zinc finger MYND domain-containing protein 11-like protein [Leptotrombidium deliense]